MVSETQVNIGSKHLYTREALEDTRTNGKSFKVCCCCCRSCRRRGLRKPLLEKVLEGLNSSSSHNSSRSCISDANLATSASGSLSAPASAFTTSNALRNVQLQQRPIILTTTCCRPASIKPETNFSIGRSNNFSNNNNNSNSQEANRDKKRRKYFSSKVVNDNIDGNNGESIQGEEVILQRHPCLQSNSNEEEEEGKEKIAAEIERKVESELNSGEKVSVGGKGKYNFRVNCNTISKCQNNTKRSKRISSSLGNNNNSKSALSRLNEDSFVLAATNFTPASSNPKREAKKHSSNNNKSIQLQVSNKRKEYEQSRNRRRPIERRFTPLEEQPVIACGRGQAERGEEGKSLSYLQREGRAAVASSKLASLRIDLNQKENRFQNESLFWRLKTSQLNEAPFFKGPLYLLVLEFLLVVLLVSSSFAMSPPYSAQTLKWKTPDSAKLLVSERNLSRQQRQVSPTWTSWTPTQEQQQQQQHYHYQQQQQQRHQNVPYKTFFITRACEWKSNLFVPKSNDIHFAQPSPTVYPSSPSSFNSPPPSPTTGSGELNSQNQESSVAYETFNGNNYANSNINNVQQQQQLQQFPKATSSATFNDGARTMLSTDSKALILALPIVMSQSFSGFESACSIRLIVPRNMRILAQLTSRRLTFAQQLNSDNPIITNPDQISAANFNGELLQRQQQSPPSLWLNVSQNQFIETEQKSFETEGNVLAFRFLLERFANKQVPDTRFQVVLTAFQTLSDNSDLLDSGQLFICDQQRLISTNLACDGFKNCQDGHDESEATCATFRNQHQSVGPPFNQHAGPTAINPNIQISPEQPAAGSAEDERRSIWVRVWNFARETNTIIGFFIGLLLVLLILTCCACCSYGIYMCWLRFCRPWYRSSRNRHDRVGAIDGESDALAAQNSENAARLKQQRSLLNKPDVLMPPPLSSLATSVVTTTKQSQIPPRLQSILKKPGLHPRQPPPAPPTISTTRPSRGISSPQQQQQEQQQQQQAGVSRGALSSSLSKSQSQRPSIQTESFRPTPARRITRPPTRPVPVPGQITTTTTTSASSTSYNQQPRSPDEDRANNRTPVSNQSGSAQHSGANITSMTTGTQRITTYHYSSGSMRFSEQYLERLAAEQRHDQQQQQQVTPQRGSNVNYTGREATVSPKQSPLI